ncbi:hypothetical protein HKX48_007295 [Thoreauomyces humboldtii]|nr:hypothetical protein HKX48_007295 [Thoreauomyces humboldtii]
MSGARGAPCWTSADCTTAAPATICNGGSLSPAVVGQCVTPQWKSPTPTASSTPLASHSSSPSSTTVITAVAAVVGGVVVLLLLLWILRMRRIWPFAYRLDRRDYEEEMEAAANANANAADAAVVPPGKQERVDWRRSTLVPVPVPADKNARPPTMMKDREGSRASLLLGNGRLVAPPQEMIPQTTSTTGAKGRTTARTVSSADESDEGSLRHQHQHHQHMRVDQRGKNADGNGTLASAPSSDTLASLSASTQGFTSRSS